MNHSPFSLIWISVHMTYGQLFPMFSKSPMIILYTIMFLRTTVSQWKAGGWGIEGSAWHGQRNGMSWFLNWNYIQLLECMIRLSESQCFSGFLQEHDFSLKYWDRNQKESSKGWLALFCRIIGWYKFSFQEEIGKHWLKSLLLWFYQNPLSRNELGHKLRKNHCSPYSK